MDGLISSRGPRSRAASLRVREWVREAFGLGRQASMIVTELRCSEPGCPPHETVVAILTEQRKTLEYKMRKPLDQITRADIQALDGAGANEEAS